MKPAARLLRKEAANGREALRVSSFCLFSEKLSEVELRDDGLLYLAEEILGQGSIQAATVIVTDLGTINEDTCIRTMEGVC